MKRLDAAPHTAKEQLSISCQDGILTNEEVRARTGHEQLSKGNIPRERRLLALTFDMHGSPMHTTAICSSSLFSINLVLSCTQSQEPPSTTLAVEDNNQQPFLTGAKRR